MKVRNLGSANFQFPASFGFTRSAAGMADGGPVAAPMIAARPAVAPIAPAAGMSHPQLSPSTLKTVKSSIKKVIKAVGRDVAKESGGKLPNGGYAKGGAVKMAGGGALTQMLANDPIARGAAIRTAATLSQPQAPTPAVTAPMQRPAAPRSGMKDGGAVKMAKGGHLTAKARHAMPKSSFALPGERYPINDPNHARNALSRVSQNGSPGEKSKVRAAVHRKYPNIGKD